MAILNRTTQDTTQNNNVVKGLMALLAVSILLFVVPVLAATNPFGLNGNTPAGAPVNNGFFITSVTAPSALSIPFTPNCDFGFYTGEAPICIIKDGDTYIVYEIVGENGELAFVFEIDELPAAGATNLFVDSSATGKLAAYILTDGSLQFNYETGGDVNYAVIIDIETTAFTEYKY